jgi:3D (Asp-Asp-Asp) domain-containing protein
VPPGDGPRRALLGAWLAVGLSAACGSAPSAGDREGAAHIDDGAAPESSSGPAAADDANAAETSTPDVGAALAPADAGDAGSQNRGDGGGEAGPQAGTTIALYVTFYGWADNSPPGAAIAYPKSGGFATLHDAAGGTGTLADPITFATDKAEFPPGTILYVPFIKKYVIMEDDCVECDADYSGSHKLHIDLWMNSNASEDKNALIQCEDAWTRTTTNVEASPPDNRAVTTAPLFDPSTNTCRTAP